ncbi:chloride channel protein [Saccharicrinis sp. FJH54]|uniref:chloride channel protein n=1 Tax=Saccharicrinis sp. FJH54 TaxID=3344665 RepID=UPI0035D52AF9
MAKAYIIRSLQNFRSLSTEKKLYIISFIVGLLSGLAAFILKTTVHYTHHLLIENFSSDKGNYMLLLFPILGIILTVFFIKVFVKDNIGHGVSKILYAISNKKGRIKPHNSWSSIIASTLTIGFGGSVGAEAPIVLTGASLGSNLGRFFNLDHKSLIVLIGCGSAGAIAGIFKAPMAGMVFTLEVLMLDLTMASLIPLLISAVTAASFANFLMGDEVLFSFDLVDSFELWTIPFFIFLGIFSGFISLYFSRGVMFIESWLGKFKSQQKRLLVGGIILSVVIFFFPSLYGEGYTTIRSLLHGESGDVLNGSIFLGIEGKFYLFALYLLLIVTFKVVATSVTTGAGGVGGIFAPSLFLGGVAGFTFAFIFGHFGILLPESNFTLVGMAGMMAGVMHAPLTAIFLIAEITDGYELFIPLMITSLFSYITIKYFESHSIYHKRLAQRGQLLTHHKDKTVLTLMKLNSVVETDFEKAYPDWTLGDLIKVISSSKRNIYPVVDRDQKLVGIVLLDDIRNIMFRPEKYDVFKVKKLMIVPPAVISINQTMEEVMNTFEKTGAWNLPVVDDNGVYMGFVSKSKIFNAYRKVLVHFSDE